MQPFNNGYHMSTLCARSWGNKTEDMMVFDLKMLKWLEKTETHKIITVLGDEFYGQGLHAVFGSMVNAQPHLLAFVCCY